MTKNFDIHWYHDELMALRANVKETKRLEKNLISEVLQQYGESISDLLSLKGEPYGIVSAEDSGFVIKADTPKKVTWDQEMLAEIYEKIKKHEDPSPYIKVKYEVSETAYKNWSDDIKEVFSPARTESHGTTKIDITQK